VTTRSRWPSSSSTSQFPPYEQVIPKDLKKHGRGRPGPGLIESLRRAQLMSSETRGVKFSARRQLNLTITSDNPDLGEVREELDVDYKR
jgi:DNA polymerase-3 subunit beta